MLVQHGIQEVHEAGRPLHSHRRRPPGSLTGRLRVHHLCIGADSDTIIEKKP